MTSDQTKTKYYWTVDGMEMDSSIIYAEDEQDTLGQIRDELQATWRNYFPTPDDGEEIGEIKLKYWTDDDVDEDEDEVVCWSEATYFIEPDEPECEDGYDHEWDRPHSIVGGCDGNPGCFGDTGASYTFGDVCMICGCMRYTAHDPTVNELNGKISYKPGKQADHSLIKKYRIEQGIDLEDDLGNDED